MHRAARSTYERWLWTAYEALNIAEDVSVAAGEEGCADDCLKIRLEVQRLIHDSMGIRAVAPRGDQMRMSTT